MSKSLSATIAALLMAAAQDAVWAAEPATADQLEEITVTATKRSESEQIVPLSMTTFSSQALEQKAIVSFTDYATKIPNLAFAPTGDGIGTSRSIAIRGVQGTDTTGFYIDDVPLPDSVDPRILDVDHIEVLRGPQGTLYGARSMGGTVRVITKQPQLEQLDGEVHGALSKTADTPQANYTGDGVVNIPLIKGTLGLRVSGFYDSQAGSFSRSYCAVPADAGTTCLPLAGGAKVTVNNVAAVNTYGGAVSLTWAVNDQLTITPRYMVQRTGYNGFPMADLDSMPGNGYGYPVPAGDYTLPRLAINSRNQARMFDVPEGGYDAWGLGSVTMKWKAPFGEFVSSTAYFSRRVWEYEDETDFIYAAVTAGAPGAPAPGAIGELKDYQRFAQEVRFASAFDGPVQVVAGGFYSDLHGRVPFAANYPGATIPNLDNIVTGGEPNNDDGIPNLVFAQDFHTDIQEPALFGEVSYTPWDPLKLTGGLRWYHVKISSSGFEEGLAAGGAKIISPLVEKTESGVNPKVEADYHINKDDMIYASVAKGFRPGGVVPIVPSSLGCPDDLPPGTNLADTRSYKSDSLWSYELGAKTSSFDHRLTLNGALFYIKWKDIQQNVLLQCGFQYITNAGEAKIRGAELEARALVVTGLEVGLGMGYEDAKKEPSGLPVQQVPDWTANAWGNYSHPLGDTGWDTVTGVDWSYIGRTFSANNDPLNPRERPAYRLLDARFALQHDTFEVAIVAKNITNEYAVLGDSRSLAAEVPGRPRLVTNQPFTMGLELRQRF